MVLFYIFSFSLLITSGIYVTDVLFLADRKLNEKQAKFIKKTQDFHRKQNEDKGNITLMGASLTLIFSFLFLFLAIKMKVELKEAQYRKESYLCFLYLNKETEQYISAMAKFNLSLRTLYVAGLVTPKAKALFQATVMARNARHFFYVKNLFKNRFCKGKSDSFSYLKNFPFKTTLTYFLQTNPDETTQLRNNQWSNVIYKIPSGIREKKAFCLRTLFKAEGIIKPNLSLETSEIAAGGFSKLKCLSGYQ